ncbi:hypothetical protein YN1_3810 [Nanoarchaeota archaeon]
MRNDISIDMIIFIIIGLIILILAAFFVAKIYYSGYNTANQSNNFINSTFENVTNTSIPSLVQ